MFGIVLRPICAAVAAAAAMVLLFGSLFDESRENAAWMAPTEAKAASGDVLKGTIAAVRPLRDVQNLWDRRAPVMPHGDLVHPSLIASADEPIDRSLAMALRPVDVEQELQDDRHRAPHDVGGGGLPRRSGIDAERNDEWLRVHTPPLPPQLEQLAPEEVEARVSREAGPGATVIVANAATNYELDGRLVLFDGGVNMDGPDFSLASDRLDVHMGGDNNTRPEKMVAYGDVQVRSTAKANGDDPSGGVIKASAQRATFDPVRETLMLEGWPQVNDSEGRNLAASEPGTTITIYTKTGKIETSGRTRSRLSMNR